MKILALLTAVLTVTAHAECVLQSNTATQGQIQITERSGHTQEIVTLPSGQHRCQVAFRARLGSDWHTALGHYDFANRSDQAAACRQALQRAESGLVQRQAVQRMTAESVLICRDQPSLQVLQATRVGTVGQLHQFRPHPSYPKPFVHNSVSCRWFLDSEFKSNDVHTYQGVICQLQPGTWVVVDKF